jgi:serine/threonine protein phosphatase PrpC
MEKSKKRAQKYKKMSTWRVAAASVQGICHKKHGTPCQDAHYWLRMEGGSLAAAVADGAGSAAFGHIGASLGARAAVESIHASVKDNGMPENKEQWRQQLTESLQVARTEIQKKAEELNVEAKELASTLLLAVAADNVIAAAQVGDGAIVAEDLETGIFSVTVPQYFEYINVTNFLTSCDALDSVQISIYPCQPRYLAVFSDGFQMISLKMPEGKAHEPLFKDLFTFIKETPDESKANTLLENFLQLTEITQRSDDDITLLLAMRKEEQNAG